MASIAQRNGQGKALRTAMRGALIVNRRRSRRNRMVLSPANEKTAQAKPGRSCFGESPD
jgi:hypothetical protein